MELRAKSVICALVGLAWVVASAPMAGQDHLQLTIPDWGRAYRAWQDSPLQVLWNRSLGSPIGDDLSDVYTASHRYVGVSIPQLQHSIQALSVRWDLDSPFFGRPSAAASFAGSEDVLQKIWATLQQQRLGLAVPGPNHGESLMVGDWEFSRQPSHLLARPLSSSRWLDVIPVPTSGLGSVVMEWGADHGLPVRAQVDLNLGPDGSSLDGQLSLPHDLLEGTVDRRMVARLPRGLLGALAVSLRGMSSWPPTVREALEQSLGKVGIQLPREHLDAIGGTVVILVSHGGFLPALTVGLEDSPSMAAAISAAFPDRPLDLERARTRTVTALLPGPTPLWIRHYQGAWWFSLDQVVLTHLCGRDLLPPWSVLTEEPWQHQAAPASLLLGLDSSAVISLMLGELPQRLGHEIVGDAERRRLHDALKPVISHLPAVLVTLSPAAAADGLAYDLRIKDPVLPVALASLIQQWWQRAAEASRQRAVTRHLQGVHRVITEHYRANRTWPVFGAVPGAEDGQGHMAGAIWLPPPSAEPTEVMVITAPDATTGSCRVLFADGRIGSVDGPSIYYAAEQAARVFAAGSRQRHPWHGYEGVLSAAYDAAKVATTNRHQQMGFVDLNELQMEVEVEVEVLPGK